MIMIDLSIVIPCYNEANRKNLIRRLNKIYNYMTYHTDIEFELIFVNDGSTDNTIAMLNEFAQHKTDNVEISIISYERNIGKGFALKQGISKAKGLYTLMTDADLSIPLKNIRRFYDYIIDTDNPQLVIGNRTNEYNKNTTRKLLTMSAKICTKKLIGIHESGDTQCGFKMFPTNEVQSILDFINSDRWLFDIELILYMQALGEKIKYIDVKSRNNLPSTINNKEAITTSIKELLMIMAYKNSTISYIAERKNDL
jgi:dolichyl-phosphate beta-glucosyltransferase